MFKLQMERLIWRVWSITCGASRWGRLNRSRTNSWEISAGSSDSLIAVEPTSTDSRTGVELSLWGVLGIKAGWVEGIELNFLGLVAGLDLRHPAVKLPGFGRVGLDDGTAVAAPVASK